MSNQANQKRIQNIFQMLFEMATGNFIHRITITEIDDEINELAKILNRFAEDILKTVTESGYIIPVYTYQSLVQFTIILSTEFKIKSFSSNVPILLEYKPENLLDIHFSSILGNNSQDLLIQIKADMLNDKNYYAVHQLNLKTTKGLIVPSFTTISKILYSDKIIVNVVTTILDDYISYTTASAYTSRPDNSIVIQQLHDYILTHLDEPLPTIKKLSNIFRSSEFSLKDGFRYFFNTSIYHFYNEERLKKAHLLLQQTTYSIKAIAIMSGFNDYPTFYKAFKKRFGYSPNELFREKESEEE